MRVKKPGKQNIRYITLEDIKKIDSDFLDEMENVKKRLGYVKDPDVIKKFHDVLLNAYSAAIELKALEREVDYEIKLAEIKQRRLNEKPWRRCWLWRLLFQPLTNRAQDIIEERAELNADIAHKNAEQAIKDDRARELPDENKKSSARALKREMKRKLNEAIKQADNADVAEILTEPQGTELPEELEHVQAEPKAPAKPGNAAPAPTEQKATTAAGQLPGQMTLDDVQKQTPTWTCPPRPPRSCRKQ